MRKISLAMQTVFSDLEQRVQDADFSETFEKPGTFKKMKRGKKYYWYWQYRDGKKVIQKYVGQFTSPDVTERVKRFNELKFDYDQRRGMVRSLAAAGLPLPDPLSGNIVEAMCRAGFFRLRGVLVGTTAYQCYSGILGARLSATSLRTADADFAQFYAIAQRIDDKMPPILDVLRSVDKSFHQVPHLNDPISATAFVNDSKYAVEFFTPNRGSQEYEGKPAPMPVLSGASAEPLRILDYLIHRPMRSVILQDAGVPVTVPSPERYAIHKLIVADRRREMGASKARKDIEQASSLIEAMKDDRAVSLSEAWQEAWERGPAWKEGLLLGLDRLSAETRGMLGDAVVKGARRRKRKPESMWPTDQFGLDIR